MIRHRYYGLHARDRVLIGYADERYPLPIAGRELVTPDQTPVSLAPLKPIFVRPAYRVLPPRRVLVDHMVPRQFDAGTFSCWLVVAASVLYFLAQIVRSVHA